MALNQFMHNRNRYKDNKPDFAALAKKYPEFKRHLSTTLTGKVSLDFRDPEALRALTCTLLKEDFGIDLEIPLDRIIPTVPLRLNYILWIEDLLKQSGRLGKSEEICGIDVGCGTSCIYPLLGAKLNGWHFAASEVDLSAAGFALLNVKRNHLHNNIQVIEVKPDDMLCGIIKAAPRSLYHFTMCNPPFFGNILEAQGIMTCRNVDRSEPSSVSTAAEGEMIWGEGGEVDFIKRMITDSLQLREQVLWYTSMIGKKVSLGPIKQELAKHKIRNVTTTEFCQGRTMRWGVGWTFYEDIELPVSPSAKRFKRDKERPPLVIQVPERALHNAQSQVGPGSNVKYGESGDLQKVKTIAKVVEKLLKTLEIEFKHKPGPKQCLKYALTAVGNTWSNQRRRRRQLQRHLHLEEETTETPEAVVARSCPDVTEDSCPKDARLAGNTHMLSAKQGVTCMVQNTSSGNFTKDAKEVSEVVADKRQSLSQNEGVTCIVPNQEGPISCECLHDGPAISHEMGAGSSSQTDHQTGSRYPETLIKLSSRSGDSLHQMSDTHAPGVSLEGTWDVTDTVSTANPTQEMNYHNADNPSDDNKSDKGLTGHIGPQEGSRQEAEFLFKCMLTVKMADGKVAVEMSWTEGRTRESMHQVGQYLKNHFSKM